MRRYDRYDPTSFSPPEILCTVIQGSRASVQSGHSVAPGCASAFSASCITIQS